MDLLNDVLDLIQKFVIIGGGVLLVFGLVNLGTSLSDHNGPGISSAIWKIIGGGVIGIEFASVMNTFFGQVVGS